MKRILTTCFMMVFAVASFANDGIEFSHGTWKEVLSKAKQENRLVFIDVYTSWCGPCKKMSAEVFPLAEVGKVFNASFINYAIDAEIGEGIKIAKQFNVRAYPTYLFVNGEGQLVYRTSGYMPAKSFLKEAAIAIREKNDPKPFVQWENEFYNGKRGKDFLIGYMKKRALLKMPSAEIAEKLFPLLTKEELFNEEIISSILYFDQNIQYVPGGKVFSYVLKNYKELDSSQMVKYSLAIMETGINNYFRKNIIPGGIEKMLPVMIVAQKEIMKADDKSSAEIIVREKELTMQYYAGTDNEGKLNAAAREYVENGLMKLDIAGIQAADAKSFKKFMEPYLTGKKDSINDPQYAMKRIFKCQKMLPVSYNLRNAAEAIYDHSKDKDMLLLASKWAKLANEWFPHFSNEAVCAGLLFKTGRQKQAIELMENASKDPILDMTTDVRKLLMKNIEKMKQGEAPKSLWKK